MLRWGVCFGNINMEDTYVPSKPRNRQPAVFFMEQEQQIETLQEQKPELRLSFFDLDRPWDWAGHERELMERLDAPGCYMTKPAPVPE